MHFVGSFTYVYHNVQFKKCKVLAGGLFPIGSKYSWANSTTYKDHSRLTVLNYQSASTTCRCGPFSSIPTWFHWAFVMMYCNVKLTSTGNKASGKHLNFNGLWSMCVVIDITNILDIVHCLKPIFHRMDLSPSSGGKKKLTLVCPLETAQLYVVYVGQAYFIGIPVYKRILYPAPS